MDVNNDDKRLLFRACLYNCQGVSKKLTDPTFRRMFMELREGEFLYLVGLSEPQIQDEYKVPGFTVYHTPRRLKGRLEKKGWIFYMVEANDADISSYSPAG